MTLLASFFVATVFTVGVSATEPAVSKAATPNGGYVHKCGGGRIFLNSKEKRVFILHNRIRRRHHLRTFCLNPKLERAARSHSRSMIRRDYFSHNSYNGAPFYRRISHFHYRYHFVGENIAWGNGRYSTPDNTMRRWMHSPEHRHNILNGKFHQIGVGTRTGNFKNHRGATMYTTDFGTPR